MDVSTAARSSRYRPNRMSPRPPNLRGPDGVTGKKTRFVTPSAPASGSTIPTTTALDVATEAVSGSQRRLADEQQAPLTTVR